MADFTTSIEIAATPAEVFEYLVTPDGLTAWMGTNAQLDARPGGDFHVDVARYPVRGEYLTVDPPHRVVVSWGFAGNDELPPGASTVEFTLTPVDAGTRVELVHRGLPEPQVRSHADGWAHFLARLGLAAGGTRPGVDDWQPLPDRTAPEAPR